MTHDWHHLTDLTGDRSFAVTKVRLKDSGVSIEGEFEPPLLARLSYEDQVFVGEFVRNHGSIKQMEKAFGVSYPTIKNRLNRIATRLQLAHVEVEPSGHSAEPADAVLDQLERGEITAAEAAERMKR